MPKLSPTLVKSKQFKSFNFLQTRFKPPTIVNLSAEKALLSYRRKYKIDVV